NPAALLRWPEDELDEADFLTELAERTDALLLVDVANLHGDAVNHGVDPTRFLARLPWERVAYAHVAGGGGRAGLYHDTHLRPVAPEGPGLVGEAGRRWRGGRAVAGGRDGPPPPAAEIHAELDVIARAAGLPLHERPAARAHAPGQPPAWGSR